LDVDPVLIHILEPGVGVQQGLARHAEALPLGPLHGHRRGIHGDPTRRGYLGEDVPVDEPEGVGAVLEERRVARDGHGTAVGVLPGEMLPGLLRLLDVRVSIHDDVALHLWSLLAKRALRVAPDVLRRRLRPATSRPTPVTRPVDRRACRPAGRPRRAWAQTRA